MTPDPSTPASRVAAASAAAARAAVGGTLLVSAYLHLGHEYQLLESILAYRLVPTALAAALAAVLPYAQFFTGAALLLLPRQRRGALAVATALFFAFLVAQSTAYARGLDISCGCFGADGDRIDWRSIALPAGCLALAAYALAAGRWGSRAAVHASVLSAPGGRAAFTLIELLVVVSIIGVLAGLLMGGVQKVRAAAARAACQNKVRQLGIALHGYHAAAGSLPPGLTLKSDGGRMPHLGWHARLLPHLEQSGLWAAAQAAFAGDPAPLTFYGHPPHAALLATPVPALACPTDPRVPQAHVVNGKAVTHTSYLGVSGVDQYSRDGLFYLDSPSRLGEVRDGTSQTLAAGERPPPADFRFGWWYRGTGQAGDGSTEMLMGVRERNAVRPECATEPQHFSPGKVADVCDGFHYWSMHPGGANFLFADGSVRFLAYSADSVLPALATRAGGEVAVVPD